MSDNNIKAACNKETLDAIALRLNIAKYSIYSLILLCIAIIVVGAKALRLVAYIGTATWQIWLLLFFLIGPAIFITIASAAANFGANACTDAIKKGSAEELKDAEEITFQSFTPFFAAPFTQFRTMFKSI